MHYIAKRIGQALFTIFMAVTFGFVIVRMIPGGPVEQLRAQFVQPGSGSVDTERVNNLIEVYTNINPSKPLWQQYVDYMISLAQGDLGQSIVWNQPVADILADAVPWTLFYASVSLVVGFILAIVIGAVMAYLEGSRFDIVSTTIITFINSVPYYIVGILLLVFFAYKVNWFPTGGRVSPGVEVGLNIPFLIDALHHAALPIISLTLTGFGRALSMRANSIQVLGSDYMRVGRLRGLSTQRLSLRYVMRNALLPLYTSLLISIGTIIGGSTIMEEIFQYPGMGFFLIEAFRRRDFQLLTAAFIITTVVVVLGILIADLTYAKLDPRAGTGASRETYGGTNLRSIWASVKRLLKGTPTTDVADQGDETNNRRTNGGGIFTEVSDVEASPSRNRQVVEFFTKWIYLPFLIFWDDLRARVGLFILGGFVFMGSAGVLLTPKPEGIYPRLQPPFQSLNYPLGTDNIGRDVLGLIIHSTPVTFKMIIAGAIFATFIAMVVGISAGYIGGLYDKLVMTFNDVLLTIPGLPLVIVIAAFIDPNSPYMIGILVVINSWAGLARTLRSQVLVLRDEAYVEAMRVMGESTLSILIRDVVPNIAPYILISFANTARRVIFASVALYFLGVFPINNPNWGVILNEARRAGAMVAPRLAYWIFFPAVAIVLLSLSLIFISQAADRVFNPRVRTRKSGDETRAQEMD